MSLRKLFIQLSNLFLPAYRAHRCIFITFIDARSLQQHDYGRGRFCRTTILVCESQSAGAPYFQMPFTSWTNEQTWVGHGNIFWWSFIKNNQRIGCARLGEMCMLIPLSFLLCWNPDCSYGMFDEAPFDRRAGAHWWHSVCSITSLYWRPKEHGAWSCMDIHGAAGHDRGPGVNVCFGKDITTKT